MRSTLGCVAALTTVWVVACTPSTRADRPAPPRLAPADAGSAMSTTMAPRAAAPADAGPPRDEAALFALVAASEPRLVKLVTADVMGVVYGGLLVRMSRDGTVTHEVALTRALASVRADIGHVGGTWPGTLFVERRTYGAASFQGKDSAGFVFEGDAAKPRVARQIPGRYFEAPQPWKGGALLTLRVEGFSDAIDSPTFDRAARFETVAPQAAEVPRFPKDGLYDVGFAAYPSGRVFALGARRSRPARQDASDYEQDRKYNLDGALVWQTDASGANLTAVQLPGTTLRDRFRGRIARGLDESETLIWGTLDVGGVDSQAYLARFGPTGWARVPVGEELFVALDIGRDGSIWAIRGNNNRTGPTTLTRGMRIGDGGVVFTPVPVAPTPAWKNLGAEPWMGLDACRIVRPRSLAVVDEHDVWISGDCAKSTDAELGSGVLLHTQAQAPLLDIEPRDDAAK